MSDRLEQGGSVLLGDGKVKGRTIALKFDYAGAGGSRAAQHADVYEIMNILASFFRVIDGPFYLENTVRNVRTRVYGDFSPAHLDGNEFLILQNSQIELEVLDGAWEDITETTTGVQTMASGDVLTLTLPNYCEDVFPIVRLISRADSPTIFSIETGHDPGTGFVVFRTILISDVTFPASVGNEIVIDSTNGKLLINGRNAPEMLAFGFPVKFDRRNQKIRYYASTGTGSVDMEVKHRVRTLY